MLGLAAQILPRKARPLWPSNFAANAGQVWRVEGQISWILCDCMSLPVAARTTVLTQSPCLCRPGLLLVGNITIDVVEGKQTAVVRVRPISSCIMVCCRLSQQAHLVQLAPRTCPSLIPDQTGNVQGGAVPYAAVVARAYGVRACVVTGMACPRTLRLRAPSGFRHGHACTERKIKAMSATTCNSHKSVVHAVVGCSGGARCRSQHFRWA